MAKIIIEAPIGYIEDHVVALNYKRRPAEWEEGEIREVLFSPEQQLSRHDGTKYTVRARWRYVIWIERALTYDRYGRPRGGGYHITVSDSGVRPL